MARSSLSKSQLFLMEFILVVMFFALCAVICISLFVKAETISRESLETNRGLMLAQSAAECIKGAGSDDWSVNMERLLHMDSVTADSFIGRYDEDFAPIHSGDAAYKMEVQVHRDDDILTAQIIVKEEVKQDGREICSLEVKKYLPGN